MDIGVGAFVVCGSLVSQARSQGKAARNAAVLLLLGKLLAAAQAVYEPFADNIDVMDQSLLHSLHSNNAPVTPADAEPP